MGDVTYHEFKNIYIKAEFALIEREMEEERAALDQRRYGVRTTNKLRRPSAARNVLKHWIRALGLELQYVEGRFKRHEVTQDHKSNLRGSKGL